MTYLDQGEPHLATSDEGAQLFVKGDSDPRSLSGALLGALDRDLEGVIALRCIGAGAVNQAIKSVAIARSIRADTKAPDFTIAPSFKVVRIKGYEKTAIVLKVVRA